MRNNIKRVFWTLLLMGILWTSFMGTIIWRFGNTDQAAPSDCAIVLGAAVEGSLPSPVFEERIRHAIHLYQNGMVDRLIFTGGFGDGSTHSESSVAANYSRQAAVASSDIFMEENSRTTLENLTEAKTLMDRHHLSSAIIVSDPLHMKRAMMMADDLGIPARSSPTPTSRYQSLRPKLAFLIREIFFWHHYLIFGQ